MMAREAGLVLQASGLAEGSFPLDYFRKALMKGRLSHAYLFAGPTGSGRRKFAREVAKAIFCSIGMPCGSCASCRAVDDGNHASLHLVHLEEGKSVVDIAEARGIAEKIHLRRKDFLVVILEDADRLGIPAANALLKTLEEPTGETVIFLIAATMGGILPTIVSRCHRIPFPGGAGEEATPQVPGGETPADIAQLGTGPSTALGDALLPDFFARWNVKEWIETLCPGASNQREAVRTLLGSLIAAEGSRWRSSLSAGDGRDSCAERLERFVGLRSDLDRNVNPELILEGALQALRRFP